MSTPTMLVLRADEIAPDPIELAARLRMPPDLCAERISDAIGEISRRAECKAVYAPFDFTLGGDGAITLPFADVKSEALTRVLSPCCGALAFAATLGMGVERYVASLDELGAAKRYFADAVASAMIEAVCDRACELIADQIGELTARFSPGYGDLSLDIQPSLLSFLNASRLLGITLTSSMLMIPRKSVSAFIGVKCAHDNI